MEGLKEEELMAHIKQLWWKIIGVILVAYTIIFGFSGEIPRLPILEESIRNLYFHVPMWFGMMLVLMASLFYSLRYLAKENIKDDIRSLEAIKVAFYLGILGLITGMIWAKVTWGAWWVFQEVKLNAAAAGMLIYAAYFVLRNAIPSERQKARFAAVYNVFAFVMYMVLIMVIPRVAGGSLHPGNGGNPGFSSYDLDANLRMVFYPAVLGFALLAAWLVNLRIRLSFLKRKKLGID